MMFRLVFSILGLLFVIPIFSQEKLKKNLEPFKKLEITGQMTAEIAHGETFEVKAFFDDEDLNIDNLQFNYDDDELTIRYDGGLLRELAIHLEIKIPEITKITARNRAEIRMKEAIGENYEALIFHARSGGKMIARFNHVPWVKADIARGGSIRLIGSTPLLDLNIHSGGSIGAVRTKAERINANISMGGEIICRPDKVLNARIRGGGTIFYEGEPELIEEDIRLGGNLEKI